MAVTQTVIYPTNNPTSIPNIESVGSQRKVVSQFTLSGTYATGGFATTLAQLGLSNKVDDVVIQVKTPMAAAVTGGYWDAANLKIVLNTTTGQLADTTSVAALVLLVTAFGRN